VWQLDIEQDNLRAALAWFSDHDVARGLRLAVAVAPFWYLRSNVAESSLHLQKLLARMPDRNALRALALFQLARLLELRRAVAPARSHAEESLAIWRELADGRGIAQTLGLLGVLADMDADFERGRTLYEEALGHARELGDSGLIIESLQHLGALAITKRQFRLAWQFFDESRARSRETNSCVYLLNSLGRLGVVARLEGDYATARRLLEQALALAREVGHHAASCAYLTGLGNLARGENDAMTARAHLEAALCLARGDSGMALVTYACLASFGALAIQQGTDLRGVRLIAAAAAGDTALGAPHIPEVRVDAEASLVSAQTAVGPHAFATAWAEGQAMTLDEAITYALTETEPVSGPAERLIADSRQHPLPANTGQLRGTTAADRRLTLTLRQREVAALVAQGRTNRQIGEALVITEGTARVHVEHILAKLGFHSRAQLAGWAVARGIFAPSI
jgi:non-specific serine/threonine protein kinase